MIGFSFYLGTPTRPAVSPHSQTSTLEVCSSDLKYESDALNLWEIERGQGKKILFGVYLSRDKCPYVFHTNFQKNYLPPLDFTCPAQ